MMWEQKRPSKPGVPPEFEELIQRLKLLFGNRGAPIWIIVIFVVGVIVIINSYYTVNPQETAVVLRFGKFNRVSMPGLHFKIPFGIEQVQKVVTGRVLQREYGYRTIEAGVRSRFTEKGYEEEARMLSGDLNVVDVQWTIQYKIADPVKYLFKVRDVEGTLDDISESVMRRMVGNRYADEVLTVGRAEIAEMARKEIQEIMDHYETGIQIVSVKLQNVNPPEPVRAAFNEVNEARQEKERMINEAQRLYNENIPKARGEAQQIITEAEGYATERVNRARGEAERFLEILAAYQKYPDITRKRMYLEAFEQFLNSAKGVAIIDDTQEGFIPFMDLSRRFFDEASKETSVTPKSPSKPAN
ncbi:MAG: FtsH protease activity modulator HflK [Thermodesulforhabdaceae bacterium]